MQPGAGSYDQVLKALAQSDRGSYGDLSYMPVFRASSLFYVVVDAQITTKVAFLNYWREKNGNPGVGVLITVRDSQGVKCARTHVRLSAMAYQFDLREMLGRPESFRGSVEIEAFSADDLKFQFPGLSVFYESSRGVSYVHTNQRVYNDAEDRDRGAPLNPWQSGFEIDARQFDPFVFIVNGPTPNDATVIDLVFLNAQGDEMRRKLALGPVPAYGARDIRLAQIEGVEQFLAGQPGMCKMDVPLKEVHLRLGAGNALKDQTWLSVTHTYFDAVDHADYFETSRVETGTHPAFVPFNLVPELDVALVFYPIYAKSTLALGLQAFDDEGRQRFYIDLGHYRSPEDGMRRIDIRSAVKSAGHDPAAGLYVLQISGPDGRIPARITYGLNFSRQGRLGTNISASAYLAKSWGMAKRSWRWGPVVAGDGNRNIVMISAFGKHQDDVSVREGTVTLYDDSGAVAAAPFSLAGNAAFNLIAEDLLAQSGCSPADGQILWYVVQSSSSSLDVNQVCISREGFVGGDHCF